MFFFSKENPLVGYSFQVSFVHLLTMFDTRFQKVSGITAEVETQTLKEGGVNRYSHTLPLGVRYHNLILERGLVTDSILSEEFNMTMSTFAFVPCTVIVSLLDENSIPCLNWTFMDAYPVKWSTSDLDASQSSLIIESMELAYSRFQRV